MIIESIVIILFLSLVLFYSGYYLFGHFYGKNLWYKNDYNYQHKVSLVISTYNEEDMIKTKIENTVDLDYPEDKLEIIFVDSSTDKTREIIRTFKESSHLNIILVEEKNRKGLASALNTGYALASGQIVIKTDCDMLLDKYSIREIVKYFSEPDIGAVSGVARVLNQSKIEIGYRSIFERLRVAEANLDSTYLFNPFSAFRKDLIEPIDKRSVADDAELALKIRKKGYKTIYSPTAIAYEVSPTSIKDRLKQKSRRAQGHIRLILQNLRIMFNPKYGEFGLIILPANFFMMILSPWLLLFTLFLGFVYMYSVFGSLSLLFILIFLSLTSIAYVKATPKIVAGFLDAQLSLIVGFLKLITKGPDFKWTKDKRSKITYAGAKSARAT